MDLSRRDMIGLGAGALAMKVRGRHHAAPAKPALDKPLVMLDPGHGGKDPGAIGITGLYEKHVALSAAEQLQNLLERSGRYRVHLTRAKDHFIPLEDRVSIAQERKADLFISMHADAVGDPHVRGASVYRLSGNASDQQSAALAAHENSVDRLGGPTFASQSPEVASILASLVRRETETGSAKFQQDVVQAFQPDVRLLNNPGRAAAFIVLKAADIPSVLVEMGFMSNKQDELALHTAAHREEIAKAMVKAIDRFFSTSAVASRPADFG